MLAALVLAWSISNCCPIVNRYRAQGYSDTQIEESARSQGVPEWIIAWAKKRCRAA